MRLPAPLHIPGATIPGATTLRMLACAALLPPGLVLAGLPLSGLSLLVSARPAHAEALRTAAVGCRSADDATKLAATPGHDAARALVTSGACMDFAKGITIDVDERRPPLACVRLTGDLSCYWMAAALVDDHPSAKGSGGKRQGGGGGRRH